MFVESCRRVPKMRDMRRRIGRIQHSALNILDKIREDGYLKSYLSIISITIMAKITIKDVREAIAYGHDCGVENLSDAQLSKADFLKDLKMGNIRLTNVWIEVQRRNNIVIPVDVFKKMKDNTVGSFIETANTYLKD